MIPFCHTISYNFQNANIVILKIFFCCFVPTVKKDVKDETDNRMTQFKKKAKELRILDAKTAQNLCKYIQLCFFCCFSLLLLFYFILFLLPITTCLTPVVNELLYTIFDHDLLCQKCQLFSMTPQEFFMPQWTAQQSCFEEKKNSKSPQQW